MGLPIEDLGPSDHSITTSVLGIVQNFTIQAFMI